MDSQLKLLYKQITEQKISHKDAVKQIKEYTFPNNVQREVSNTSSAIEKNKTIPAIAQDLLLEKAIHYFKKLLSSVIKLPANRIEADVPLEAYGIDSVMVIQLTNQLEKTFGSLSKTLFFEYQSIQALTGYFIESYRDQLIGLLGIEENEQAFTTNSTASITVIEPVKSKLSSRRRSRFTSLQLEARKEKTEVVLDIAIIGVSGCYPQAKNIEEFWKNLRDGKDCITEIPKDRWDHSLYFDTDKNNPGKTYSKWGGFLDRVDQFDTLFFNISPREAELMDPQERLFLQCVYETLEDAGYTREALDLQQGFGLAGNVGVFVGVMYEEYQLYGAQEQIQGRPIALAGNPSSIANRVSYFCNFHGPSMAVDTMCSSSLTAIHLACQSLQRGSCKLAIAGGVNVSIHPNKYLALGQGKFVSSKGRCESFGQGGDGYVPGEGVGAVLLKPLSRAIADGDHIYGIVKATALNHGGKTNGYTVPNPNAQASVIGQAMQEAGIDPRAISYIEAHGTGTSLGDPIEITGLTKAFQEYTNDKQFCAIGSAKSNIGHCESAAGIAGVTKVLLQLKYRQLVPSLHSEVLNSNIDFGSTPFIVQQELAEWKRPTVEINGKTKEYPRIAGISSFGAGGSNAHVVIEEYIPKNQEERPQITITPQNPAIIVLSAKNEERLKKLVRKFLAAIRTEQFTDTSLADIAYTLQVGREAMEERLGLIVGSVGELTEKLEGFVADRDDVEDLYRGQVKRNKDTLAIFSADEEMQEAIDKWIQRRKYAKFINLWVKGLNFDWDKLYGNIKPCRISLPTYPFARERYWVPKIECNSSDNVTATSTIAASIHPLLHQNTSNFSGQRFSSVFTGREFFLTDYVMKGRRILPGVALLEMARAAVEEAIEVSEKGKIGVRLANVVWSQPVIIGDQPVQVHIGLYPEAGGEIAYEIYSEPETIDGEFVIHSQGIAMLSAIDGVPTVDIKALQAACGPNLSSQFSDAFRKVDIDYGPDHQGIEAVYKGTGQVLAKLSMAAIVSEKEDQFVLYPRLLDYILQASIGLMMIPGDLQSAGSIPLHKTVLPFTLQELEIFGKLAPDMWAFIRYTDTGESGNPAQKFDIDLCDDQGTVCLRMKGISLKVLEGAVDPSGNTATLGTLMFHPCWQERAVAQAAAPPVYDQYLVILCEPNGVTRESIETQISGVRCLILESKLKGIDERFQAYVAQAFEEIQSILRGSPTGRVLVQIVISAQHEQQLFSGISGLLKTAQLENPKLIGQLIEVDSGENPAGIVEKLKDNSQSPGDDRIRYQDGKRRVAGWSEVETSRELNLPWKDRGIYLITGGTGGLGLIFVREIAHKVKNAILILTGRSLLSEDKKAQLKELETLGPRIEYRQVDVTQEKAVVGLIEGIREDFGSINGIMHSAGVMRDDFILRKTKEDLQEVMASKVKGLVNLDQASKDMSLDFLICFSSVAGAMGNQGQVDYAAANAFMDAYATYRNNLVDLQQRHGQTLSINWPLWKEGGMSVDAETEKMMLQNMGIVAMQTSSGIRALYQAFASGHDQVMVVEGSLVQMRQKLLAMTNTVLNPITLQSEVDSATGTDISSLSGKMQTSSPVHISQADTELLREKTLHRLKVLFGGITKLSTNKIDAAEPLESYGIDSVMITQLNQKLADIFGELSKTLFYEYQSLEALVTYFIVEHPQACMQWVGFTDVIPSIPQAPPAMLHFNSEFPVLTSCKPGRKSVRSFTGNGLSNEARESIAIIGISGRYPQAKNLKEYWDNLQTARDCITEIPAERWSMDGFYHPDPQEAVDQGKSYSKWGGFVDGFADFEPLFFNISPREAISMDPQERLFVESCWEVFEDAGYTKEQLITKHKGRVGVFVGITKTGFDLYGPDLWKKGERIFPRTSFSSVANRISYLFNLQGPSMPIDTMCSSSLTAIHEACEHLYHGECEMAIAGGVNLYLHPSSYIGLCGQQMLSADGQCKSFGAGGNGFVPGEGVGVVLLKPLSKAIVDGDHIYAVIRGTSINHGGKTNGYTIPNPNAQGEVIRAALEKAQVDARTVSYIEAHGTGTKLGDPIEITGLTQAFRKDTQDTGFCAIGSVKSNMGHLEAAAGIAGVTKIILQMKNQKLVPSLHAEEVNPNINFAKTPFVVQRAFTEWVRPVVEINGVSQEYPRIAGISSFGAGGSNAHVVIEEYIPKDLAQTLLKITPQNPAIIVLSAKSAERLHKQAQHLLTVIGELQFTDSNLADVAYTLQVGREAMEERLGLIVGSVQELVEKLKNFVTGKDSIEDLYRGQVKRNKENLAIFAADEDMEKIIEAWLSKGKYAKLLDLWVKGLNFDWNRLYGATKPRRISLPTYPFDKQRYWIPESASKPNSTTSSGNAASNHRVQQQKPSNFSEPPDPQILLDKLASQSRQSIILPATNASVSRSGCDGKLKKPGGISLRHLPDVQIPLSKAVSEPITLSSEIGSFAQSGGDDKSVIHVAIMKEPLQEELATSLAETLYMERSDINVDQQFVDLGLDSIIGVEWIKVINQQYNTSIPATKIYDYPTIREFAEFLANEINKGDKKALSSTEFSTPQESSTKNSLQSNNLSSIGPAAVSDVSIPEQDKPRAQASPLQSYISAEPLQEQLTTSLAETLYMERSDINVDQQFVDLGLDSIIGVEWIKAINKQYGILIQATKVYDYPTIREFAEFLANELNKGGKKIPSGTEFSTLQESSTKNSLQPINLSSIGPAAVSDVSIPEPGEPRAQDSPLQPYISAKPLQEQLTTSLAETLYMERSDINVDQQFVDLGLDSIIGVEWIKAINKQYGISIQATKVYDYPTIREFAEFLANELSAQKGELDQPLLTSAMSLSFNDILQQVQLGTLDVDQADRLLHKFYLKEEQK